MGYHPQPMSYHQQPIHGQPIGNPWARLSTAFDFFADSHGNVRGEPWRSTGTAAACRGLPQQHADVAADFHGYVHGHVRGNVRGNARGNARGSIRGNVHGRVPWAITTNPWAITTRLFHGSRTGRATLLLRYSMPVEGQWVVHGSFMGRP